MSRMRYDGIGHAQSVPNLGAGVSAALGFEAVSFDSRRVTAAEKKSITMVAGTLWNQEDFGPACSCLVSCNNPGTPNRSYLCTVGSKVGITYVVRVPGYGIDNTTRRATEHQWSG